LIMGAKVHYERLLRNFDGTIITPVIVLCTYPSRLPYKGHDGSMGGHVDI